MGFNKLFNESVVLWPDEIDISDGVEVGTGVRFQRLCDNWDNAELKAKSMGEWYDLMTWIIFKNLNRIAVVQLHSKDQTIKPDQIDLNQVKIDLLDNLDMEAYKDMLAEFKRDNQI